MSATATWEDVLAGRARWCVVEGDCLEVLPTLPVGSIDHAITDPPYAARAMKNFRSLSMVQRRDGVEMDFGYAALSPAVRRGAAKEIARIVRRWALVWCDAESDHAWRVLLKRCGMRYLRTAAWLREHGAPQFSGDRPAQDLELCVIAHAAEGRSRWNGGWHGASSSGPIVNSQAVERKHPTPKPFWLMASKVDQFTDPDELVLDPFAGSGTTGVACLRLGRRCILIEKSPKYAALARERMKAESQGLTLRDARVGQLPLLPVG